MRIVCNTKIQILFFKNQDNSRYIFMYKKSDTLGHAIFHESFETVMYIQKSWHFVLCLVLYTNSQSLRKNQDNLYYVFVYKKTDTLCYAIFEGTFEICKGGKGLYTKKCTLRYIFIYKNNAICVTFYTHKKPDTLHYIFMSKEQCTFRYVFISKIYLLVLIPNFKQTYYQNNQIDK